MAINERIKFLRNLRNQTQKWLGIEIGFPEKSADVRMAQYETGVRTPKTNMVDDIAKALEVNPLALEVPDIDTRHGLIHTLFALEDLYGFIPNEIEDRICLTLDINHAKSRTMSDDLRMWYKVAKQFRDGEITKEQYDEWRYNYPDSQWQITKSKLDEK